MNKMKKAHNDCSQLYDRRKRDRALEICTLQERSSTACGKNALWAQETLTKIYREKGDWSKVADYAGKILHCQPDNERARRILRLATKMARNQDWSKGSKRPAGQPAHL